MGFATLMSDRGAWRRDMTDCGSESMQIFAGSSKLYGAIGGCIYSKPLQINIRSLQSL